MTIYKLKASNINFYRDLINDTSWRSYNYFTGTASKIKVFYNDGTMVLNGTGFKYDSNKDVTTGTITGITWGTTDYFSKLSVSATAMADAIDANNGTTIFNLIFSGNDTIYGYRNRDVLVGGTGNDKLFGNGGNDKLEGSAGADRLDGGLGADRMYGGTGNDTYYVEHRFDRVYEGVGAGTDRVKSSRTYTLRSNLEKLVLTGTGDINGTGNGLNNTIVGNRGDNALFGGGGNDILKGGSGIDIIGGGNGRDLMTGGTGRDVFVYVRPSDGGDRIRDFNRSRGDKIGVLITNFGLPGNPGTLKPAYFRKNAGGNALDGEDYFVFNTSTSTLYFDSDGNGGTAAIKLARFTNGAGMRYSDIILA